MAEQISFLLFGDQSLESTSSLLHLYRPERLPRLSTTFLDGALEDLRREINKQSIEERRNIPEFSTLHQLVCKYRTQANRHPGLESALLCMVQLAHYIDQYEKNYEDLVAANDTYISGLCTGLFAAIAVASSPSLSSLVSIGVQVVLMAYRTGSYVASIAKNIEASDDNSQSWTYIVSESDERKIKRQLDAFNNTEKVSRASQAYISSVSTSNIAVSGPPTTWKKLLCKDVLEAKPTALPVYGPYHAPHLHTFVDIENLLSFHDEALTKTFATSKPCHHLISCVTGIPFEATDIKSLLKAVVYEILNEPLSIQSILQGSLKIAQQFNASSIRIVPFGPSQLGSTMAGYLRTMGNVDVVLQELPHVADCGDNSSQFWKETSFERCKLAIVGMAGRFPDADNPTELWELLENGVDTHRIAPPDRFDVTTHVDPTGKAVNTSHTPYGCWIRQPGRFDPKFFQMSPREALSTDPMQRMALMTAYEALEMSGFVPNRTPSTRSDRVGTFYGQSSDDWREVNASQEIDIYYTTGGLRAFGPGRISYTMGFSGPSFSIDTACSSSGAALHVACTSLWARECDTAVVGGLSCITNPDVSAGLSRAHFLSKTGNCRTFDNNADGYCRADACASIIVKRLDDALSDKDKILAVILGIRTNHSPEAASITHPHGPTQARLSSDILDDADLDPLDVHYVEVHGTATQAGDRTEMVSVADIFAPASRCRPSDHPIYLGSVKPNIGHAEAASGITALIKVLLMFQMNAIPPHIGIKGEINKTFPGDLIERGVRIASDITPFSRTNGIPRRVVVNNFSAAGGSTGLLIEDHVSPDTQVIDPRTYHVVTVTAKSKTSLIRNGEDLIRWLEIHPEIPLSDIAYTATARRIQHPWRLNAVGRSIPEVIETLKGQLETQSVSIPPALPTIAITFTGQGSVCAGLGSELYAHYSVFQRTIDELDHLACMHRFPSFLPLIDGSEPDIERLPQVILQVGLVCFEIALAKLWDSWGVRPTFVIGHSLGEYAALHIAGILSASDTVYLVGMRAELLTANCTLDTHTLLAVRGSVGNVRTALNAYPKPVNISCINGPQETVLGVACEEIAEISQQLESAGLQYAQLAVPFAFHSSQVEPILDQFEALAAAITFHPPRISIISSTLGKLVDKRTVDAVYLRNHTRMAVNFLGAISYAQQSGIADQSAIWLEVGSHAICTNMVKSTFGAVAAAVPSLYRGEEATKTLSTSLCALHSAGVNIDWNSFHGDFASSVNLQVLPSYSFEQENYWLPYRGDWCLTKNRCASPVEVQTTNRLRTTLPTSSVQRITKQKRNRDRLTIQTESQMARYDLREVCAGYVVDGKPQAPTSLFGDMAVTMAEYVIETLRPDTPSAAINVVGMSAMNALILDKQAAGQTLHMSVEVNAAKGFADIEWTAGKGAQTTRHAQCKVFFDSRDDWVNDFDRATQSTKPKLDALLYAERGGNASKLTGSLVYRMFSATNYGRLYRGIQSAIIDSKSLEGAAYILLQPLPTGITFHLAPYWIDSIYHLSSLILNLSVAVGDCEKTFIANGWGSMRFIERLSVEQVYVAYIRLHNCEGSKTIMGDVHVFKEDKLIGLVVDLCFQTITRKVLDCEQTGEGLGLTRSIQTRDAATQIDVTEADVLLHEPSVLVSPANLDESKTHLTGKLEQIIAEEARIPRNDLCNNTPISDFGVDSLLQLAVARRIEEQNPHVDPCVLRDFLEQSPTINSLADCLSRERGFRQGQHS